MNSLQGLLELRVLQGNLVQDGGGAGCGMENLQVARSFHLDMLGRWVGWGRAS